MISHLISSFQKHKSFCKSKFLGFSLAEVLTTLTVIGVVASITVPVLIKSHEERVIVANLKKAYAIFYEANKLSNIDNGPWKISTTSTETATGSGLAYKYYKQYLNVIKDCGVQAPGCWGKGKTKNLNGEDYTWAADGFLVGGSYSITLSNGMYVSFDTSQRPAELGHDCPDGDCWIAIIFVDVNGNKGPNTIGRDIFIFVRTNDGILRPAGFKNSQTLCKKDAEGKYYGNFAGGGCTYKVLSTGKIDY